MKHNRKKRVSLSLRFQPYEGDLLAEVVNYLNDLPRDEVQRKVADILVTALLPIARYTSGKYTTNELHVACWEAQDSLNKHCAHMRLAIGVEQPQMVQQPQMVHSYLVPTTSIVVDKPYYSSKHQTNAASNPNQQMDVGESNRPTSIIPAITSSSELDNIFGGVD